MNFYNIKPYSPCLNVITRWSMPSTFIYNDGIYLKNQQCNFAFVSVFKLLYMKYVVKINIACTDFIAYHLLNGFRATVCIKLKSCIPSLQLR